MSNKNTIRRILIDIQDLINDPIENCYIKFIDEDVNKIYVLIVGTENTPYDGGFYLFQVNFTTRYPFEPPKVKFLSTYEKVRFHPNLYEDGKVCLSILGTWSGPQWTSVMNLRFIVLTLQCLFCENPVTNEPGFETELTTSVRNINYNKLITFYNWKYSIMDTLEKLNEHIFHQEIRDFYNKNYETYKRKLNNLKMTSKVEMVKAMYSMKYMVDYSSIEIICP